MANILLVDDERSIRKTLSAFLTEAGYDIDAASDAQGALDLLGQRSFDVIVSDIVLPGMNGIELLQAIGEAAPFSPVIMITGEPTVDTAADAVRLRAFDYLSKPVGKNGILRSVGNAARVKAIDDERRRLEKQNREYQQSLEDQNQELRRAAEFREEVEAIARHDLKSPLNLIIGAPQILLDMSDNLTEKQCHYLEMIENAGRRMLDMINLSLDLFQIEHGMYKFRPTSVDGVEVVHEVVRHQEPLALVRKVTCELLIGGCQPAESATFVLPCERLLLYSSLSNLLKNAIEASPSGETVTIDLRSDNDSKSIRIRNRGEVPPSIRERFFQKHTTSGKEHGVGLGAYSAKLMTEAQGGSIQLDSSQPDATTVLLRFQQCATEALHEGHGTSVVL